MSRGAITASLEDFARTGRLGPLSVGLNRDEVLKFLGAPTDFLAGKLVDQSAIWKYGDVEVYFADDVVSLVHFDRFEVPVGGPTLKIEPWVIRRGLPLDKLEDALRRSSIEFSAACDPSNPKCVKVVTSAGVAFVVQVDGEACELGLSIFGRSAM